MPRSTLAEHETIIRWDDADQVVEIYSSSPQWWPKLAKLGFRVREETTWRGEPAGRSYEPVPVSEFRFRRRRLSQDHPPLSRKPRQPAFPGEVKG